MDRLRDALLEPLDRLRQRVFAGSNQACYIERERILRDLEPEAMRQPASQRYAWTLERLLGRVSTPIEDDDVFLGRTVEAPWDGCTSLSQVHQGLLPSGGHLTLDWPTLLTQGLSGVVAEARATAERLRTPEARSFADNAASCARAVTEFAQRYARMARERARAASEPSAARLLRAATALDVVPDRPAYDLFSALQSVWLIQLVMSCYIGSRDFGFGRMDQYLSPFYDAGLADGSLTPDTAVALLAHFLMKPNEITGTATHNYRQKPTPCQSSKQYLLLGGRDAAGREQANELSERFIEAAILTRMPQPVLTVCLDPQSPERFRDVVAAGTARLASQIHFYNDGMIRRYLATRGLPADVACEYVFGGCCRFELGGISTFIEKYHSIPHWLLTALSCGQSPVAGEAPVPGIAAPAALTAFEDVLAQFRRVVSHRLQSFVTARTQALRQAGAPFHFESLLLNDCVTRGKDCDSGGSRYVVRCHNFAGIATVANSLVAIQQLVYVQRRFSLPEFLDIMAHNFEGRPELREEILRRVPKFGNDQDDVDTIARRVGEIILAALDAIPLPPDHVVIPGFYSLQHHHSFAHDLPATPDGRLRGEPFSENQSPSYGTDTKGLTALLQSVARLPLDRTALGGLNVKFGGVIPAAKVRSVLDTFFGLGGLHVGFSFVDRETLRQAREHPDEHRTLTVRMYGFSEYFVSLSPLEQQELIERTEYGGC